MRTLSRRQKLAAIIGGVLCGLSLPPFQLLWGYAVLPGLALVMWSWNSCGTRRALLHGWLGGLGFFGVVLEWTRYFGVVAVAPLVMYMALGWGVIAALSRSLRLPIAVRPWAIGAFWIAIDGIYARAPFGGLPWGSVGLAMHNSWVRESASVWGIAGVSFLLVVAAASIAQAVATRGTLKQRCMPLVHFDVALVIAIAAVLFRSTPEEGKPLRIAALQANVWNRNPSYEELASRRWLSNAHLELASELHGRFDLIVFPESSLDGNDLERDSDLRARVVAVGADHDSYVLANGIRYKEDPYVNPNSLRYNTDYLYAPDGRLVGEYAKIHLVPFGEYLPLRGLLSWIPETERVGRFAPGNGFRDWNIRGVPIANIICFESVFGPFTRDAVRSTDAQIIVVATNNRSYERSGASEQHVALSKFRAIELHRPVVHAADSGISAFISADGNITARLELFERGALVRTIRGATGDTLYLMWGDWLTMAGGLFTLGMLLRSIAFRKHRISSTAVEGATA